MRIVTPIVVLALLAGCAKQDSSESGSGSALTKDNAAQAATGLRGPRGRIPLMTLDGKQTLLSDHAADVTVIAVWATFCKPCMDELPLVEALYQKYRDDKGVSIVAISMDSIDDPKQLDGVRQTVQRLGLTLPVFVDRDDQLAWLTDSHAFSLPTFMTIDSVPRIHVDTGFELGLTKERFLTEKSELIELARAGKLSPKSAATPRPLADGTASTVQLPAMTADAFDKSWPSLRSSLRDTLKLTDDEVDALGKDARAQASSGKPITLKLPDRRK